MTTKKTHATHKFQRKNLTRNKNKDPYYVFACVLPGCLSYIRCDLALGKSAICNRCCEEFVMDKRSVLEARPHCVNCIKRTDKVKKARTKAEQLMKELGIS